MTDLATLARPEPERDRWGRYRIPDPETGKVRSWTRVTTFASSIADTYGLGEWKKRMVAFGVAHRPDLYAEASSITDPDAAKKQLGTIADAAMEAAGSSRRARLGTALHAYAEQIDSGANPDIPAPWDADIDLYRATMSTAGIQMRPDWIERVVINPAFDVAGTFDRLVIIDGQAYVADLKTGRNLSYSWGEIAIQLASYAAATHIYDVATGQLVPMPDVHQDRGLVIHLPVGETRCELHWVDLSAGREAAELCGKVRAWRKRKDLAEPFTVEPSAGTVRESRTVQPDPATGRESRQVPGNDLEALLDAPPAPVDNPVQIGDVLDETVQELTAKRRTWLINRIIALPTEAKQFVANAWPAGVPTFKGSDGHDNQQLSEIAAVLDRIEGDLGLPFSDPDPARTPTDDADDLRRRAAALPADMNGSIEVPHRLPAGQAPRIREAIEHLEREVAERINEVNHILDRIDDTDVAELLLTQAGTRDGASSATAGDVARLDLLVDAFDHGHLGVTWDPETEKPTLVVPDGIADRLITEAGGKRNLLAAMREHARTHLLTTPKSVADGLTHPLVVAETADALLNTNNPERTGK